MVLDASDKIPRVSPYSGYHRASLRFRVRDFHPLRSGFPTCSTIFVRSLVVVLLPQPLGWFGLFPFRSPLLRESLVYFLFLQLLRCFNSLGFPIRIPPDRWLFTPPRGFSQLIASFFGCRCQGIHRTPFIT